MPRMEVNGYRDIRRREFQFVVINTEDNTVGVYAPYNSPTPWTWEAMDDTGLMSQDHQCLRLGIEMSQQMLDVFWREGLRPTNFDEKAGDSLLQAMQERIDSLERDKMMLLRDKLDGYGPMADELE